VLGIAYRNPLPALVAVLPTAVAAGWATGILFVLGTRSSPITILLAGVVVAFATEFSVLWLARYRAELRAGQAVEIASDVASRRIGPAVIASALALILGFAVLGLSPVPMVRDFGIWSAADLALATAAVLILLPPVARRVLVR
jgi:predicted RND superfamily exporter protein